AIQVVRWNGRALQLAGSVDAGATVNDLVLTPAYLYAATSSGLAQYDLLNPNAPAKTGATFTTSAANVGSLALTGNTLYATDGDGRLFVAAGDIGLLTYDVRQFAAPFPLRSYATVATGSVAAADGRAYFGRAAGIVEYVQTSAGALTEARSWDKSRADVVHDV